MPIDLSDSEVQSSAAALQQRQQFTAQKNAPDLGLTDEDLANSAKSIGAVPGGDANPYAKLSMAGAAGKWLLDGFSNDIGSLMAFGNQAGKAMTEAVGGIAQTVAPGQSDAIARDVGKLTENSPANQAIVDNHQTAGATGGFVGDLALFLAGGDAAEGATALAKSAKILPKVAEKAEQLAKTIESIRNPVVRTAVKGVVPGAVAGGTGFAQEGEDKDRLMDAGVGAAGGAVTSGVLGGGASALIKAGGKANQLASDLAQFFTYKTQVDPAMSRIKGDIDANFENIFQKRKEAYAARDRLADKVTVSPQATVDGADSLRRDLQNSTVYNQISPVVDHVERILGVQNIKDTANANAMAIARDQLSRGIRPPQIKPIRAPTMADVFTAVTRINDEMHGASPAEKTQLLKVRAYLNDLVDSSNHPKKAKLLNLMDQAADLHKEWIVPLRKEFKFDPWASKLDQATGDRTKIEVFHQATKALMGNAHGPDAEKLDRFMKLIGPSAPKAMQDVALYHILKAGGAFKLSEGEMKAGLKVKPMKEFLEQHDVTLQRLLPPKQYTQIKGFVNLLQDAQQKRSGHSQAGMWLYAMGVEHVLEGEPMRGAMLAGAGLGTNTAFRVLHHLTGNSAGQRILEIAGKGHLKGPELEKFQRAVENNIALSAGSQGGYGAVALKNNLSPQ